MITVVPPDNKSLLVEANKEHREHHEHHREDWYTGAERVKDRVAQNLAETLQAIRETEAAVYQTSGEGLRTTERVGGAVQLTAEKVGAEGIRTTERVGGDGRFTTERVGAAGMLLTEKMGAKNEVATLKAEAAVLQAQTAQFMNTQNLLISGFKDGRYDAATLTASILQNQVAGFKDGRYDAAQNAAMLQKQISDCCCELKEAISSEGNETRALMNAIDARRADRELVDSKNEVNLLKLQIGILGNGSGPLK